MNESTVLDRSNASMDITDCAWCGVMMAGNSRKRYCSDKCRLSAWKQRHNEDIRWTIIEHDIAALNQTLEKLGYNRISKEDMGKLL
jgi:hypothetical protein